MFMLTSLELLIIIILMNVAFMIAAMRRAQLAYTKCLITPGHRFYLLFLAVIVPPLGLLFSIRALNTKV